MFNQFSNLKLIQTALQNVVMDLQSGTQVMDSTGHNLDEVLEKCLLLKQDLANASQIIASSSVKIRRYPVRRRPTGLASEVPTESPPQTNKKKVRNGDKSKKRGRHGPVSRLDTKEGQTTAQVKTKSRQTRVDPVSEEDIKEDIVIESEVEGWSSGIEVPGVSLEQMIAAFKTWNRSPDCSEITPKSPSIQPWMSEFLPGPSGESEKEVSSHLVSSKVPRMDLESAEVRSEDFMVTDEAQKDPSSLEECTLSNGYTLQSFQFLQRDQEGDKTKPEIPCFTPMIQPESYTSPSSLRGFIPTWQASSKVVKKSKDLEFLIPRELSLTEPMVERLEPDQVKSGINVKDFLARMDTNWTGNHPIMTPPSFDRHNLTNNIDHLFVHLLTRQPLPESSPFRIQDLKAFAGGDSMNRGGGGSTDEDRLRTLSRQLENLYDPKEKNELSELLSTMDC